MTTPRKRPSRAKPKPDAAPPGLPADAPPLRLEWRSPAELVENPANWKTHPETQTAPLKAAMGEVGWAGACLFNERSGRLIDGHARRKLALADGTAAIPVLIGSWTEEQERLILLTLDPLSALAGADSGALDALLRDATTGDAALKAMLADMAAANVVPACNPKPAPVVQLGIFVSCATEEERTALIARLTAEGLNCAVMQVALKK